MKSALRKRFLSGSLWSFINIIATQGVNFVASIIIARSLGADNFGQYGIIINTYMTLSVFTSLGFQITLTKYIAEYRNHNREKIVGTLSIAFLIVLILNVIATFCLIYFSSQVSTTMFHSSDIASILVLISPLLSFLALNNILNGAIAGFEDFKSISKISFVRGIIYIPLLLLLLKYDKRIGPLLVYLILNIIVFVLNAYVLWKRLRKEELRVQIRLDIEDTNIITKYSLPAFLAASISFPMFWLAQSMLTTLKNGFHEVGVLNAANQWQQLIMLIPNTLAVVALPLLSFFDSSKTEQYSQADIIDLNQKISIIFIAPLAITFFALNDVIMGMYGHEFVMGNKVLVYLILGISISGIGYPAGTMIQAKGRMWLGFVMNLTWGGTLLFITYILYEHIGALAYSIGFCIAHLLLLIWGYLYIAKSLPKGMLKRTFIIITALILMAIISIALQYPYRLLLALVIPFSPFYLTKKLLDVSLGDFIRSRILIIRKRS